MSRRLAKSSAVRLVRSLARKAGFSERRYDVRARSGAGACELWLRARVGPHLGDGHPVRAGVLRLGRGRSWDVAAFRAARALGADVRRVA